MKKNEDKLNKAEESKEQKAGESFGLTSLLVNVPSVLCSGMATFLIVLDKPYWWVFVILAVLQITSIKTIKRRKVIDEKEKD